MKSNTYEEKATAYAALPEEHKRAMRRVTWAKEEIDELEGRLEEARWALKLRLAEVAAYE